MTGIKNSLVFYRSQDSSNPLESKYESLISLSITNYQENFLMRLIYTYYYKNVEKLQNLKRIIIFVEFYQFRQ